MILEHKGIQVFFEDQGKGSTIVLLHGFLENRWMWKEIAKSLEGSYRVISIDLPGHGETPCLGYVHSMELMAEVVHSVLKSLRLRKITLIGHSMGGYVSLAFAEKYPEMLKGICLMNSTAQADSNERKELRARANKMVQTNFANMVRMSVSNLFDPTSLEKSPNEVEWVKKEALKTSVQGYIACMEGMRIRPDRVSTLHNVNKVHYIIGQFDPIMDSSSIVMEAQSVHANFTLLKGGHMSHIENKLQLIEAIRQFVKSA